MKRKVLTLLMVVLIVLAVLPFVSFAGAGSGSVVFKNADTGVAINEIANAKNINAEVVFTASETGKANVITAGYKGSGALSGDVLFETIDVVSGEKKEHTTASFDATGAETVKVFVWMKDTMSPVINPNGYISKTFEGGTGFSQKLNALCGTTQDSPYVAVKGKAVSIGELFEAAVGTEINSKYFNVLYESVGGSTASAKFIPDASNWADGNVTFSGEGLLKLTALDYDFCIPTDMYVNVVSPVDRYETVFPNTDTYLYRVGNSNAVKLGSLFKASDAGLPISNTAITVDTVYGNARGTFTKNASNWAVGTIKFTGTGVVNVTISDDNSNPYSLLLEIVDGTNATVYSEMKSTGNVVMLNDISISEGAKFKLSNSTLYGNGFTFDVSQGNVAGANMLANYLLYLNNSTLDNVRIIGAVYTEYSATTSADYNNPVVLSSGDNVIANSYIANCSSPVRVVDGNIEIINTTLKGGNFANLDIRNGNVTLENVTTINQVGLNDEASDGSTVVGLGVVIYYEGVLDTTTINIKGEFTQYNHLSKNDVNYIKDSTAQKLFNAIFNYGSLVYTDEKNLKWVSSGILSMTSDVGDDNISDLDGYIDESPTAMGTTGYVHTSSPKAPEVAPGYETVGQYTIAPKYTFDYTTKNYVPKTNGSNDYCYYNDGAVSIAFDDGKTFSWDTSILTAEKLGKTISYKVTMNGTDYTGKSITFDQSGEHDVVYTYTDSANFSINANNELTTFDKTYTKIVHINVKEVMPDAKHAEFAFGEDGIASTTVMVGNDTYVMPDDTSLSYKTVNGQKIYYPTVEMFTSDGKWVHNSAQFWKACFPVFSGAVTITDYASGGFGDAIVYDSSTTELPAGLSVPDGPESVFIYNSGSAAPSDPEVVKGVLCYVSPRLSNNARGEMNVLAKYKYQDNAGAIYYYYINYHCQPVTKNDGCVTGDTLVTLSDGSQKRLDALTYEDEMLVWDFYSGEYTVVPPSYIQNHGYASNTVIKLIFDDGTVIKAVNEHAFFDADLNEFVFINAQNLNAYIGHNFVKQDGSSYKTVKLEDYEITEEYIEAYSILTYKHYNCLLEGMLALTPSEIKGNLFMPFTVGENMTFDKAKMQADIEKYGLYTYEEFADKLTLAEFEALNMPYIKVAVGKGILTYDEVIFLLDLHFSK